MDGPLQAGDGLVEALVVPLQLDKGLGDVVI